VIDAIADWARNLGAQYGVNPWIFATLYIGAIPFFFAAMGWALRRRLNGQSTLIPLMCAGFCFVSAYLYLALVGRNVPVWVWIFLVCLIVYGAVTAVRDFRRKIAAAQNDGTNDGTKDRTAD
jgi:hypothetical protein